MSNSDSCDEQNISQLVAVRKPSNFKDLKSKLIYNAILVGIIVAYGLAGAFVFKTCEAGSIESLKNDDEIATSSKDILNEIVQSRVKSDVNEENLTKSILERLDTYIKRKKEEVQFEEYVNWRLSDSWLFACTIFTTVGKYFYFMLINNHM